MNIYKINKIKILKSSISICNSYQELYSYCICNNSDLSKFITLNNVHSTIEAFYNANYKKALDSAFIALPDGKPLSIVAKLKGHKDAIRIMGPTFMEKTLEWGQKDNIKHFFFGSLRETLKKIEYIIKSKYPASNIVGAISPPFRTFTEAENKTFLEQINKVNPDIIWVGLGAPKQEIWMYENYKKLNRGIMIGIGAGFDYLAGNTKHAPEWMKNFSLEWLYRLIQEPKRLWKRYLVTNTLFLFLITLELLHIKNFKP
jgi:N-acetylglucosaminyldiphosphoundecaprenol N-acetyl-beta-D-mannosaminyltransferase